MQFTDNDSIELSYYLKRFHGLIFLTHFVYIANIETFGDIRELSVFVPQEKEEELYKFISNCNEMVTAQVRMTISEVLV